MPQPGEQRQGGHEVLCLGYDLPKQLALIQNSWGEDWGQKGYFWIDVYKRQLEYVRFGSLWGEAQTSQAALSQDRDFWYDAANYALYVYSASGNPATHYSTVAPIALSGESLVNLNGVSWLERNDLRRTVYDRLITAGISFAISIVIAWRDRLGLK